MQMLEAAAAAEERTVAEFTLLFVEISVQVTTLFPRWNIAEISATRVQGVAFYAVLLCRV